MAPTAKSHVTKHTLPPRLAHADGVVYASQGRLYTLDANDGRVVREYEIRCSQLALSVVEGVIYTGVTAKVANGEYAFAYQATSAASGALLWSSPVQGRPYYAPLVIGDTVLVAVVEGTLYALDRATGRVRWRWRPDGWLAAAPVVSDGLVYVSPVVNQPDPAFVYALDVATGRLLWRTGLPETAGQRLAVHGDSLYAVIPNGGGLIALDRRDRAELWRQPLEGQPSSAPVVTNDAVYLVCARSRFNPAAWEDVPDDGGALPDPYAHSAVLVAVRAQDGAPHWERAIGAEGVVTHAGEPVAAGEAIYVGASDGALYAFDATSGAARWRTQTGGDLLSTPTVMGDTVCVGASDGYVYALDTATGQERWRTFTRTGMYTVASVRLLSIAVGEVHDAHDRP